MLGRTVASCRRRLWVVVVVVVFAVLGYTGVVVVRAPYSPPYGEAARAATPAPEGKALTEARESLSLPDAREILSLPDAKPSAATPLVVLVLSSSPRGGSTLLTELLAAVQGAVVLFEPLWLIEKTECYEDEACVQRYLADVFSCTFRQDFEAWLKHKKVFFQFFSKEARRCIHLKEKEKEACIGDMDLRALCEAAPLVVVKVVRARLAWLHNLLEDSLLNLKVLHLTRDPRGSIASIRRFRWNSEPHARCSDLEDDMLAYERALQAFPTRLLQVRYEQLCLAPKDTAASILHFLLGNSTLPAPVSTFLTQHMLSGGSAKGSMSTVKNSTEAFQAWRFSISDALLKDIEAEPSCLRAIQRMGHAVFGSQDAARNATLPLVLADAT